MKRIILLGLILFPGLSTLWGQGSCFPYAMESLTGNKVRAMIRNRESMFYDDYLTTYYQVPWIPGAGALPSAGSYTAFWIGGVDNNSHSRVAVSMPWNNLDFSPGPIGGPQTPYCTVPDLDLYGTPLGLPPLKLADGRFVIPFYQMVKIYNPQNGIVQLVGLPTGWYNEYNMVQMGDGRVLFAFDGPINIPNGSQTLVMDTVNFTISNYLTISYNYTNGQMSLLPNGNVLLIGQFASQIINPFNNTVVSAANYAFPMASAKLSRLPDGRPIAFAENALSLTDTTTIQVYDPNTDTWSFAGNMLRRQRNFHLLVLPDSSILIVGRHGGAENFERYYPNTQTTVSIPVPYPLWLEPTIPTLVENGEVIFWPYNHSPSTHILGRIWKYNSLTGEILYSQIANPIGYGIYLGLNKCLLHYGNGQYFTLNTRNMRLIGQPYQRIWKVKQTEIDDFRNDYANGTVNFFRYPDILDWPAHGNPAFGESHELAPFVDVDGNGEYEPAISGDYPCIRGSQSMWWVVNDSMSPHHLSGGQPMGIEVGIMAYVFDCNTINCPDSFIDYSTFYHYTISNRSNQNYTQTRIGTYHVAQLGSGYNDYLGSDTTLNMGYVYDSDTNDLAPPNGYGNRPPALGLQMLHAPFNGGMGVFRELAFFMPGGGLPNNPAQYYQIMGPHFLDGSYMVNNGLDGYPGNGAGPQTNFLYPGDAGFCGGSPSGWTQISAGSPNQGFRDILQTSAPFNLPAHSTVEYDLAILWAQGNDNLESVCLLKQLGAATQPWWDALQSTSCNLNTVGIKDAVKARPTPLEIYPNPSDARSKIRVDQPLREATIAVWSQMGQIVQSFDWPAGDTEFELDGMNLPSGLYHVLVTSTTAKYHANWVIER